MVGVTNETEPKESRMSENNKTLALREAKRNVEQQENALRRAAEDVKNRVERALRSLEQGQHVNALGELQGAASDFDRTCALREAALVALEVVKFAVSDDE